MNNVCAWVLTLVLVAGSAAAQTPALTQREFELRFAELDRRLNQRFDLGDRAVEAALTSMNARLDGMNEFRATLRDQATGFVSRAEWQTRISGLEEKVRSLELAQSNAMGRSTQTMLLIGLAFTALTFALRFIDKRSDGSLPPDRRPP